MSYVWRCMAFWGIPITRQGHTTIMILVILICSLGIHAQLCRLEGGARHTQSTRTGKRAIFNENGLAFFAGLVRRVHVCGAMAGGEIFIEGGPRAVLGWGRPLQAPGGLAMAGGPGHPACRRRALRHLCPAAHPVDGHCCVFLVHS